MMPIEEVYIEVRCNVYINQMFRSFFVTRHLLLLSFDDAPKLYSYNMPIRSKPDSKLVKDLVPKKELKIPWQTILQNLHK